MRFCTKCNCQKPDGDFYSSWKTRCKTCIREKQSKRPPEYVVWLGMRQRCRDKNCASYKDYGGRGITIAPEWDSYEQFRVDMGERPSASHSIERLENDLGYSKANCCWALKETQNRNRRTTVNLTFMGQCMPIRAWAIKLGLKPRTLHARIHDYGWTVERALTQGVSHA